MSQLVQVFGSPTEVTGWSTALSSVAGGGDSTSGTVDNSAGSFAMDVQMSMVLDAVNTSGTIDLYILASLDNSTFDAGISSTTSSPRLIGKSPVTGSVVLVSHTFRVYDLPKYFKFHLKNTHASTGLGTGCAVYYQLVDLVSE